MIITHTIRWADNTATLRTNLKEGLNQIEATRAGAEKMVQALGGDKLIAAAHRMAAAIQEVGGVTKLTAAEQERANTLIEKALEKYRALGIQAPTALKELAAATKQADTAGGLLASTFGQVFAGFSAANLLNRAVGTLTDLGREALATAGSLVDLSNKTGLSTETIQRMQFVAKQSGSDMSQFADAAFKMGVNISEGTKKARDGAQALGLSWKDLRAASPDAQFNMVVQALERMEDPQKRNEAAVALFGKTAKDVLPAIVDGYSKVAEGATVAGDAQVRALDAAGDAWDRFKARFVSGTINAIGNQLLLNEATANLTDSEKVFVLQTMQGEKTIEAYNAALIRAYQSKQKLDITGPGDRRKGDVPFTSEKSAVSASFIADLKAAEAGYQALTAAQRSELFTALQLNKSNDEIINSLNITDDVLAVGKKAYEEHKQAIDKATAAQKTWNALLGDFASVAGTTQETIAGIDGNVLTGTQYYLERGIAVEKIAKLYGLTTEQVQAVATQMKFEQAVTDATTKAFGRQAVGLVPLTARYGDLHEALTGVLDDSGLLVSRFFDAGTAVLEFTDQSAGAVHLTSEGLHKSLDDLRSNTRSFGDTLKTSMQGAPAVFAQAFTGGGGVSGALKSVTSTTVSGLFGEKGAFEGATRAATGGLTKIFGSTIGKALGGAIPFVGPALAAFAPAILGGFKKLFGGVSEEEKKGRESVKAFETQLASTLTATQKAEAGGQSWKMTTIAVRDAYLKAGKSAEEAEAAVTKLWNSSKLGAEATKAAIEEINGVLNEQKQDEADLQAAIQRYGFSVEQLGPAMQKQKLDEQAKQLLNDWRLLVGSGIAITDVNGKMASSVNDYLQLAKRTGQEVPTSMKPILQSMIDQGSLLDENGVAITDMGQIGVSWSESMTAGFDRVVNKLQQLLEGLGLVPKALDQIPTRKDIVFTGHYEGETFAGDTGQTPSYAARGGLVTAAGVQYFGWGGIVKPLPRGTDTVPAMLTPGEMEITPAQQAELFNILKTGGIAGRTAGSAPVVINERLDVHLTVETLDPSRVPDVVENHVMPEITRQLEDFRRGYTARWRQVLTPA